MSEVVPRGFKARQQYYLEHWGTPYPYSWKKNYAQFVSVFRLLQFSGVKSVVELGCNDGGLAVELMRDLLFPLQWTGYDFLQAHLDRERWHPNYKSVLMKDFLWNLEVEPFDVFVVSHVLEHLYADEIQKLALWLSSHARFLVCVSPLGQISTQEYAKRSGHILTKGFIWVSDVFQSVGFKPVWETGKWFGWFQKK